MNEPASQAQSQTPIPTPGLSLQRVEMIQGSCNGCESVIPRCNVVIDYSTDTSRGVQQRSVKAYCDHCSVGYELIQELRNGEWIDASGVTILDHRARQRLCRKLAPVRRERYIAFAG